MLERALDGACRVMAGMVISDGTQQRILVRLIQSAQSSGDVRVTSIYEVSSVISHCSHFR